MTIKMFSELTGTSIDTLKHYDRVGLLKPYKVDSQTSYRYYTAEQAIALAKIKYFRSMEMPISEIKKYLDDFNVDLSIGLIDDRVEMLKKQIDTCETQIAILSRRRHYLNLVKHAKKRLDTLEINLFGDRYYYSL